MGWLHFLLPGWRGQRTLQLITKKYCHDDTKKYKQYQQIELLVINILKNTLINKEDGKEYFKE